MKRITYADLDRWEACCRKDGEKYCNKNLVKRGWGPEGITPLELSLQRWIPVEDRVWGLLREDVLGDEIQSVVDEIVDGVVRNHCLHCGHAKSESWAEKWLSGEDRSKESAGYAADVAEYAAGAAAVHAAYAAYAAAHAAYAGVDILAIIKYVCYYCEEIK